MVGGRLTYHGRLYELESLDNLECDNIKGK